MRWPWGYNTPDLEGGSAAQWLKARALRRSAPRWKHVPSPCWLRDLDGVGLLRLLSLRSFTLKIVIITTHLRGVSMIKSDNASKVLHSA